MDELWGDHGGAGELAFTQNAEMASPKVRKDAKGI
jgi:hypothetical protein